MLGLVQLTLDQSAWALWSAPAGAIALGASYVMSQIGQRFAAEQTRHLTALVEDALGTEIGDAR